MFYLTEKNFDIYLLGCKTIHYETIRETLSVPSIKAGVEKCLVEESIL